MADEILLTPQEFVNLENLEYFKGKQDELNDQKINTAKQELTDYVDDIAEGLEVKGTAQTKMEELANGAVKDNTDAIAKLNGDTETEGSVAKAVADVKAELEGKITESEYDDTEVKADIQKNAEDIAAINHAETGILKQAKDYADGKDEAITAAKKAGDDAQADVDALEEVVTGMYTNEQIDEKVKAVQDDVDGLEGTVNTLSQTVADNEADIEAKVKAISDDYLKASDKTELQGNIDTVNAAVERLTNGVSADEVDGVNDLIQYVKDHGTEVTGMQEGIADNAEAIEAVAGRATTLETDMTQAKTDIDAVEAAVATKVEQEAYNAKVTALEGEDTAIKGRLDALEEAVGEGGDVASQIDTKIADLDADVTSATVEEGKGLQVQVKETDGKVDTVVVTGNFDNSYDVKGSADTAKTEAIEAAATDATTKANQAEANAKAEVTALAEGAVADNATAIAGIQASMPTAIANEKIDAIFNKTE